MYVLLLLILIHKSENQLVFHKEMTEINSVQHGRPPFHRSDFSQDELKSTVQAMTDLMQLLAKQTAELSDALVEESASGVTA